MRIHSLTCCIFLFRCLLLSIIYPLFISCQSFFITFSHSLYICTNISEYLLANLCMLSVRSLSIIQTYLKTNNKGEWNISTPLYLYVFISAIYHLSRVRKLNNVYIICLFNLFEYPFFACFQRIISETIVKA